MERTKKEVFCTVFGIAFVAFIYIAIAVAIVY
jgi:hypothetical protein